MLGAQGAGAVATASGPFDRLPDELLLHIFSLLPPQDLVHNASAVCSRWRAVAKDERLWSQVDLLQNTEHFTCILGFASKLRRLDLSNAEARYTVHRVDRVLESSVHTLERLDLICCQAEPLKAMEILRRFQHSLTSLTIRLFDEYISHQEIMPLVAAMPLLRTLEVDGKHHNRYRYNIQNGFQALRKVVLYNIFGAQRDVDVGVNLLNAKGSQLESLTVLVRPLYYPVYNPNTPDLALEAAVKTCVNVHTLHIEGVDYLPCIEVMDRLENLILEGECSAHRTVLAVMGSKRLRSIRSLSLVHVPDPTGAIMAAFLVRCTQLEEVKLAMRGYLHTEAFHVLANMEPSLTRGLKWQLVPPPVRVKALTIHLEDPDLAMPACAVPSQCRALMRPPSGRGVVRVPRGSYKCEQGRCLLYTEE